MGLDIRVPIGVMFLIVGGLLVVYGLITAGDAAMYARSLSININLWWGGIMFAFGLVMFMLGRRGGKIEGVRPAEATVEGLRTEAREKRLGLENNRGH